MASTSETGHAKNVANFEDLLFAMATEAITIQAKRFYKLEI